MPCLFDVFGVFLVRKNSFFDQTPHANKDSFRMGLCPSCRLHVVIIFFDEVFLWISESLSGSVVISPIAAIFVFFASFYPLVAVAVRRPDVRSLRRRLGSIRALLGVCSFSFSISPFLEADSALNSPASACAGGSSCDRKHVRQSGGGRSTLKVRWNHWFKGFFGFKAHRAKISLESINTSIHNVMRRLRRSIGAC